MHKIIIKSTIDKTDHLEIESDALIVFTGKLDSKNDQIEYAMAFSGNKRVMVEIIKQIPSQISAFLNEQMQAQGKKN